jgi:RHS repeat-associated protein
MRRLILTLASVVLVPVGAVAQTGQAVEYYHTDVLGSVRVVTNAQGQVIRRHDVTPFGEEVAPASPPAATRLFTGKERDAETGLDYFGARYYRPDLGRFTSVDPAMALGANLADPQRWNRYSYARSNPLKFVDRDGRYWVWVAGMSAEDRTFIEWAIARALLNPALLADFDRVANSPVEVRLGAGTLMDMSDTVHVTGQTQYGARTTLRLYPTTVTFDIEDIRANHPQDPSGTRTFVEELMHVMDALFSTYACFESGHLLGRVDSYVNTEVAALFKAELAAIEGEYLDFLFEAALAHVRATIGLPVLPSTHINIGPVPLPGSATGSMGGVV